MSGSGPGGLEQPNNINNVLTALAPTPMWVRVGSGLPFNIFQTAALTLNINLFSLPAAAIIHATRIKHSVAFAGTSITAVNLSVGISGTVAKYASAFDIFQAVSATAYQNSATFNSESFTASTQITATITSIGANLSALTTGNVDIWCLLSLPN